MTQMALAARRSTAVLVVAASVGCPALSSAVRAQTQAVDTTRSLTGRVLESGGAAVDGAVVGLYGASDTATTSDSGRFVLNHASPGPHMLWVRRLGFEMTRAAVTIAPDHGTALTLRLVRTVPLLPTVSTTAATRAYREIGLDRRMQAGIGQFLTYEQIQSRHADELSQLLDQMRGIKVWTDPQNFEATVDGTRGVGSCVGYDVDGVPQTQLYNPTGLPTDDADNIMDPAMIGAIEVYSSSERPVQFGPGREERPLPIPGTPPPAVDVTDQQCALVVIWTKARLGLLARGTGRPSETHSGVHGQAAFPTGPTCQPPSPVDTTDVAVYATLNARASHAAVDPSWSRYAGRVLAALRGTFVMPSDLPLPAFGYALQRSGKRAKPQTINETQPVDVEPTLSAVAAFTLDSVGGVSDAHIAVSSLSGAADTSLLAAIADAAAAHAFPNPPTTEAARDSAGFDLIVSTARPAVGDAAALVGRVTVPVWQLTRRVGLAAESLPSIGGGVTERAPGSGDGQVEFVVDQQGRVAMSTVRVVGGDIGSGAPERNRIVKLNAALLDARYEPALIGACPVAQMTNTSVAWRE